MRCVRCSLGENSWRVVVWCLRSCEHWMRCVRSSLGENSSGVWCLWSCEHWMQEKRCLSLTSATSRCMDCRPFPVFLWRNNLQKKALTQARGAESVTHVKNEFLIRVSRPLLSVILQTKWDSTHTHLAVFTKRTASRCLSLQLFHQLCSWCSARSAGAKSDLLSVTRTSLHRTLSNGQKRMEELVG